MSPVLQNKISLYELLRSAILPLKEIDAALPQKGKIVDLGAGRGVIARYLATKSDARRVIGIDLDSKRFERPQLRNLKFVYGDIRQYNVKGASGIILSDVLHHLTFPDQKRLLRRICASLVRGGVLAIKEIDTKEAMRSKLSRFWDFIFYPKDKICYTNSSDLIKFLENLGFVVFLSRPRRLFPGSTTLYICEKR